MSTKKRKPLGCAIEEFVFGTREAALPPAVPDAEAPVPTPTASLIRETPPTPLAARPALTPPRAETPAAEPVPVPSQESSLTHRFQAPDPRSNGQVCGGCLRIRVPQGVGAGSQDGAQESEAQCRCWWRMD
jgi:hypothetical protein